MPSEDLHKPLKAINKSIARLHEAVQTLTGEVKKIKTAITEAANTIRDAIHENIQAQAELKLMEHVMDVRSVKPQIEAERDQIQTERDELDQRLESIGQRYQDKHDELDEKASERIRTLGSHIFEINEDDFEDGIEEPFTDQVTTAWSALREHNESVRDERVDAVRNTTGNVVQTIHDYVGRQEDLVQTIQKHRLDADAFSLSEDDSLSIQAPYYVVEYEVDGVTEREMVVPSRLSTTDDEWCSVSVSPISGAEEVFSGLSGVDDPDRADDLSETAFVDTLGRYGESSLFGLSYADAAAETLPENGRIPVAIEGREN